MIWRSPPPIMMLAIPGIYHIVILRAKHLCGDNSADPISCVSGAHKQRCDAAAHHVPHLPVPCRASLTACAALVLNCCAAEVLYLKCCAECRSSVAQSAHAHKRQCMQADPAAALQHFQAAAAQGDAYATFNLGYMHMKGIGTQANATAAKASFEVAARQGIPSAFNGLGVLYFEGAGGGSVDYAAAREAFVSGSELGDPDAMFNLATMYAGMATSLQSELAWQLFFRLSQTACSPLCCLHFQLSQSRIAGACSCLHA